MAFARYLQARMVGSIHGQNTVNVWNFGSDSAVNTNQEMAIFLAALANAIIQCAINQLLPAVTSDWQLLRVEVQQLHPVMTDPIFVEAPAGQVGARGTVNASFETIIMRVQTGLAGKSKRGRNFLPPPGDADLVNSLLTAGDAANFYAGFIACLAGKFVGVGKTEPYTFGVLSRKHLKDIPGDYANAFTEAAQLSIDQKLTHLHSRKLTVGG